MGGCRQNLIEYDKEYNSSVLKTNTGCKFEIANVSSNWLNDKYIEKEVEYEEWYKQDYIGGEWYLVKK